MVRPLGVDESADILGRRMISGRCPSCEEPRHPMLTCTGRTEEQVTQQLIALGAAYFPPSERLAKALQKRKAIWDD